MQSQEVKIKPIVKVVLKSDAEVLDEVVVTAYGTSTKGSFTGSAAVMKADKIEKRQVSNVSNALAGAVAGVQILSNNGQPGEDAKVRIRGVGSINAGTDPLYVVDGVPYDGDLSSINSADIESMTVLKDAASTALYGARGANGIIMITTKKGTSGKARASVGQVKLDVNNLTEASMKQYAAAQGELANAFSKLMLVLGLLFIYLPMLILVIYSFNASKLVTVWGGWSLKWYAGLLDNTHLVTRSYVW
jgi:TonB-dependent SusC/RagA subfamily outer membrane receptor